MSTVAFIVVGVGALLVVGVGAPLIVGVGASLVVGVGAPLAVGLGASLAVGLTIVIYVDATRTGVSRPRMWSALVFITTGGALALYLFTPVPIPGVLVVAAVGVVFYAFERDDHLHGDEPSDPRLLPGGNEANPSKPGEADRSEETDSDG